MQVYISNSRSTLGKSLAQLLQRTEVGSRAPAADPSEDEEPAVDGSRVEAKHAKYAVSEHADTKEAVLAADVIVLDLLNAFQEATAVLQILLDAQPFAAAKTVVAVSTFATWARTKLVEDADALAEDEFRRRKPHPNFTAHVVLEKEITKAGKINNLKTYIIVPGAIYHPAESIFHYLFKSAWNNEAPTPCYGEGVNNIPCIHLDDLVNIIVEVVETLPEQRYILAVDDGKSTLGDITKRVSELMGPGAIAKTNKEEALLTGMSQQTYDLITTGVRLDPGIIKDFTGFEWKYESGIVENMPSILQDYKKAFGLQPVRIMVHGPPGSRKTWLSKRIADHYGIHYLNPNEVMQEIVTRLETKIAESAVASGEDPVAINEFSGNEKEILADLKETLASTGKYSGTQISTWMRQKLVSMPCRNQGYVLDGYPALDSEADGLYKGIVGLNSGTEEDEGGALIPELPDHIFNLECSDVFIKDRLMKLADVNEDPFVKTLDDFRKNNRDDNTVLNYFDEKEIHPLNINMEINETRLETCMGVVVGVVGTPKNFGPSPEKLAEIAKAVEDARLALQTKSEIERVARENEEVVRHNKAQEEWSRAMSEIRVQEAEILQVQSLPLREYLMKHVIPTVSAGLIEIAKMRPDDPIDYLAEYLFKQNPNEV